MKKQINPFIKAHLIRSVFYVTLLLAVCVIPFALAQRNTKRSAAKPNATATLAAAGPRAAVPSTGAATALGDQATVKAKLAADLARRSAAAVKSPGAPASLAGTVAVHPKPAARAVYQSVPQEPNLSPWTIVANYPWTVESTAVCSDGTYAYSAGGYAGGINQPLNAFYRYDPVANTWTQLANLPEPVYDAHAAYAANVNKVYVFGGDGLNTTYIYDIASDTWTAGAVMPDFRSWPNVAYYNGNGKIYVIGGLDSGDNEQSQTWEYDPVANTWNTSRANDLTPQGGAATIVSGQYIYLAGAYNFRNASTVHNRYDPVADTWTSMAAVPVPIWQPGSGNVGGQNYLFGGGNISIGPGGRPTHATKSPKSRRQAPDAYTSTYIYDIASDSWSTGPNLNNPHSWTGGTAIGTKLIIVAGFDGVSGDTNIVELADAGGGGTCADYTFALATGTFVPGVTDIGSHCDDCDTPVTLPFPVTLYDQTFTTAEAGSNGHLTFGADNATFAITCSPFGVDGTTYALGPYWTHQVTFNPGQGIFTTTTGTAPNRVFYIEWRSTYFGSPDTLNYEVALYENGTPPFQYIYNTITPASAPNDSELVVGVKKDDTNFDQYGCDPSGGQNPPVSSGQTLEATCVGASPTPTPTATPTPTPTPTATCPPGGPDAPGPWTGGNPYPITIARYGFAQTATHFYVFGGVSDNGNRVNNVNRMDLSTGTWESRAPMPFTSQAPTCALDASSGIVYCAEGDTGNGFAAYDTNADTWTSLANTPNSNNYGSASGAFNGKVFLAGGTFVFTNAVWVYDIASNTWSSGTSAPDNFLLAGYQQVGQFLYLAGGWTGGAPTGLTTTRRLDMSSAPGTWDNGPAFTMGRSDFDLAYDAGTNTLYALGGDTQGGGYFDSTNEVDELPLSGWPGGTWNPSPPDLPLPVRQANQAGFYGNGDIWSVGGIDATTFQFLNEVWRRSNAGGCASPTPTPTATFTPTPSATATATPTPTARTSPTPRPRPTPMPRPTLPQ
jgi:N-acetylneuraminic acid mutarotase